MFNVLSPTYAGTISDSVRELLQSEGYEAAEIIPGLVTAICDLASEDPDEEALLDEAMDLLAAGGMEPVDA